MSKSFQPSKPKTNKNSRQLAGRLTNPRARNEHGGILLLSLALVAALVAFLSALLAIGQMQIRSQKDSTAAEAASLAAASELSRIVITDPHFGHISLSDRPPIGRATTAADGEPLPVLGINTILATVRLDLLIADNIGNSEMIALAKTDLACAKVAEQTLSKALVASLQPESALMVQDLDGNAVSPYKCARTALLNNLAPAEGSNALKLKSLKLSLGWLSDGCSTLTPAPQPESLGQVKNGQIIAGNYKAFVDVPCAGESFYFAGISAKPSLVEIKRFMPADGKRFSSIVKVEAEVEYTGGRFRQPQIGLCAACAEPYGVTDAVPPGAMLLGFPDGIPNNIKCFRDFLSQQVLQQRRTPVLIARGGDYPNDRGAQLMQQNDSDCSRTVSQIFSTGFYDWIRSAHLRPRLDSILSMLDSPFRTTSQVGTNIYTERIYEFSKDGQVLINTPQLMPFASQTVYENQPHALTFDAIEDGGTKWALAYRDQIRTLGPEYGGKHGGQSQPGNPINWCDLPAFGGNSSLASRLGKGQTVLALQPCGSADALCPINGAISADNVSFAAIDGATVTQPRHNYYSGGLGVEFQISSPVPINSE